MTLRPVSLDDKYDLTQNRVFVTGYQALIRACLMQKARDRARRPEHRAAISPAIAARRSAASISNSCAPAAASAADIKFQPGINEELAATALWGSSRPNCVARASSMACSACGTARAPASTARGDVFRHANLAGTAKNGGVLALMGDDHTAESSTTAHQSEFHFVDVMMPILNPAGVQEIIDYALYGWACRVSPAPGTALKCMHEYGRVDRRGRRRTRSHQARHAHRFHMPQGGLNIRLVDTILGQEARLHDFKRDAMLAFVRANKLNKIITSGGRNPKIGVITTGKAYLDVRQALDELGIDEVKMQRPGAAPVQDRLRLADRPAGALEFAQRLDLIIVVEEKRSLIEVQVREELYGTANQPVCIGKKDEQGNWLFPVKGALDPNDVAICIGERLLRIAPNDELPPTSRGSNRRSARWPRLQTSPSAFPISARAARTIPRPACRKAAAPMPASAAISCRNGWIARRSASPRWAARASTGSARRRSPRATTSSRISATAPITTPAISPSARPSLPA